jgi:hypothetical protein
MSTKTKKTKKVTSTETASPSRHTLATELDQIIKDAENGKERKRTTRRKKEVDYKNPDPSHLHQFESKYQDAESFPKATTTKRKRSTSSKKKSTTTKKRKSNRKQEKNPIDDYAEVSKPNREDRAIQNLKDHKRAKIKTKSNKSLSEQYKEIASTTEKKEERRSRSRSRSPAKKTAKSPSRKSKSKSPSRKSKSKSPSRKSKSPSASPKKTTKKTTPKKASSPKKAASPKKPAAKKATTKKAPAKKDDKKSK